MTREQAKEIIKQRISCKDYLEKSKGGLYICPFCGSGTGPHVTGALKVYDTNTWTCFSCHKSGDVLDLYQQRTGADYNTALSLLAQECGLDIEAYSPTAAADFAGGRKTDRTERATRNEQGAGNTAAPTDTKTPQEATERPTGASADYTAYYRACVERLKDPEAGRPAREYLARRGISVDTAAAYWIGYDPEADPAGAPGAGAGAKKAHPCPRLIIPSSVSHYVGRRIDGGKDYAKINAKDSHPAIFNGKSLYAQDVQEVFVVEGALDALSIMEAGAPAIALNSAGNVKTLLDQLTQRRTAATLILCKDNDADPRTAATVQREFEELAEGLRRLNISFITADINGSYKDANEALTGDRPTFLEAVEDARRKTAPKPDNTAYYIRELMSGDIARFRNDKKTGFANLDAKAGGLYSGLYVLAAISSLGKTSFALQIADQLAESGQDVLFFSLEQSRLELVSKSLARRTAQNDPTSAVTSLNIRKGYLPAQVKQAAQEYQEAVSDRMSIIEGNLACTVSFIGDYIRRYIQRNDTRPVVFLDYLQILQPESDGGRRQTVRETVDSTITELKRISRELDLTVIVISSVNRANYLQPIDFESLKESGGIEFTADVVFGLQLQCLEEELFTKSEKLKEKRERVKQAKAESPRKIELVCLKNRYGIANYTCFFDYFPANDLFVDTGAAADFAAAPSTVQKKAGRKL